MHILHEEIESNGELGAAISKLRENIGENSAKQGLVIDINPVWRAFQRIEAAGLDYEILKRWTPVSPNPEAWSYLLGEDFGGSRPDFSRSYHEVAQLASRNGSSNYPEFQPFILRIIARPEPSKPELLKKYKIDREHLARAARACPILTVVEDQPPPQLLNSPGSRFVGGSGQIGTLGGFVRDLNTGRLFAVTCGHVFPSGFATPNGWTLSYLSAPHPSPPNMPCTANCSHVTDVDIALLQGSPTSPNVAQSIAGPVWNGQYVEMDGAVSGRQIYQVGAAVVEHEIGETCWRRLIQFHAPVRGILPAALQMMIRPPPKPGDSGAWLRRNTTEWAGMVVASNSLFGYALCADVLINEVNRRYSLNLVLA